MKKVFAHEDCHSCTAVVMLEASCFGTLLFPFSAAVIRPLLFLRRVIVTFSPPASKDGGGWILSQQDMWYKKLRTNKNYSIVSHPWSQYCGQEGVESTTIYPAGTQSIRYKKYSNIDEECWWIVDEWSRSQSPVVYFSRKRPILWILFQYWKSCCARVYWSCKLKAMSMYCTSMRRSTTVRSAASCHPLPDGHH